jgi:hypothetical protein
MYGTRSYFNRPQEDALLYFTPMKQIFKVEDKPSRRLYISVHKPAEPVFENPFSSPGIDSQPGGIDSSAS